MNYTTLLSIPKGAAVCYSGFREGQRPGDVYPTYEQVKEDLTIVQNHWRYIRLYSCDQHAHTVLEVIRNEQLPIQVMLGAYLDGEQSNPNCPWGGEYSDAEIDSHKEKNKNIEQQSAAFGGAPRGWALHTCHLGFLLFSIFGWLFVAIDFSSGLRPFRVGPFSPIRLCLRGPYFFVLRGVSCDMDFLVSPTMPENRKHVKKLP